MMRPARAFIMPRMTPRDKRNTPRKLVAMTASKSSSFMRMLKPSRVMPALLTKIAIAPSSFSIFASTASVCSVSAILSNMPMFLGLIACKPLAISAAPASEVAVPMTIAPRSANVRAMARPMPRDAPVTRAI